MFPLIKFCYKFNRTKKFFKFFRKMEKRSKENNDSSSEFKGNLFYI